MSDLREAAEMALEVLSHSLGHSNEAQEQIDKTKQALRQALAQDALRKLAEIDHELGLYIDAVNTSQERVDETAKREHECPDWDFLEIDEDDPEFESCLCYTAPPKKEWVGLTDVDIYELMDFDNYEDQFDFARAIEAKLKEKNS